MAETFWNRVKKGWNAFKDRDSPVANEPINYQSWTLRYGNSVRPDRMRFSHSSERTLGAAVFNRLATDCAVTKIRHVQLDRQGRYAEDVKSGLNRCLTIEANKDQAARAFLHDMYASMFDEGCIAVVPIDTSKNIRLDNKFEIYSMRVGKISDWYPDDVRVMLYNDRKGYEEPLLLPKKSVAIIENPFYAVMNESSSNIRRLLRKLSILDAIDEQSGNGKLDLLVQLPFAVKGEMRTKQAEDRRKAIEEQLVNSKYGIAYIDSTEHVTQLNRPLDNNIMSQVEYLTQTFYTDLGISQEILNGTAGEEAMNNYYNRIIEPPVSAASEEFNRKFLTDEQRERGETVMWFNDPFRVVSASAMGNLADQYTRNEIMSTNEIRQKIGMKPVDDPMADELRNKNLNASPEQEFATTEEMPEGGNPEDYETY